MPDAAAAGTPAAGTPAAGTPAAGTPAAGTPAAGTPAPAWHGVPETDTEGLAYINNKGWKGPSDVIKSYQGAEKLIGKDPSQLLVMPRADDPAGYRAVMAKLGMPESPDKYEFDIPQGAKADDNYVKWARSTFHELGLPASVAKTLSAKHNEFVSQTLAQQEKDYNLSVASDKQALLAEWKGGHERMMLRAQTAAKALGFTTDMIDAMERTVGYAATMKHFANLGGKMGEDSLVLGKDGGFNGTQTPAEAKAEWDKLKIDPVFTASLRDPMHPAHQTNKAKQAALFKLMYPE